MENNDRLLAAVCVIAIIFFGALMIGFRNGAIQDHAKINTEIKKLQDDRDFIIEVAADLTKQMDDITYADEIGKNGKDKEN